MRERPGEWRSDSARGGLGLPRSIVSIEREVLVSEWHLLDSEDTSCEGAVRTPPWPAVEDPLVCKAVSTTARASFMPFPFSGCRIPFLLPRPAVNVCAASLALVAAMVSKLLTSCTAARLAFDGGISGSH